MRAAGEAVSASSLTALRRFINANTETLDQLRPYVRENVAELAAAFGVAPEALLTALDAQADDAALAALLRKRIQQTLAGARASKKEARALAAQAAADAISASVTWDGDRASLDIETLLATALTKRGDLIVFACDAATVEIPQAKLLDIAKLKLGGLSGFVDAEGLHVRWSRGGLNLRSHPDPSAERIVLSLSRTTAATAA